MGVLLGWSDHPDERGTVESTSARKFKLKHLARDPVEGAQVRVLRWIEGPSTTPELKFGKPVQFELYEPPG
jgi:hypothetical protein